MVKMQGVAMTEKYRTAAQTMDLEYQKAMQAEKTKKDTNQEKKKQDEKDGAQKDAKAKQDANAKNTAKNATNDQSLGNKPATSAPSKVVVRLVNGTGKDALAAKAKSQLEAAGFVVIMDGSSSPVATTSVTATNVAPSVLNALSRVPFAHENRINKVEGAGCDGIVLLGQDYK
jgi:hypothetical protein